MAEHPHAPEEITCREFVELATDLIEHALPEDRLVLVEEHLIMCDWCVDYLRQVEATVAALPAAPAPEPVPAVTEQALLGAFRAWREERA